MNKLSLYYYETCGFCRRVLSRAQQLGVELTLRNIRKDPAALKELADARGRTTVPVLRIDKSTSDTEWMPESRDIIQYLETL